MSDAIAWPGGARFAVAIVDDTDRTTLANGPLVYDLLTEHGIVATKTVWMLDAPGGGRTGGASCADPAYLRWVLELQGAGHEVGFHGARDGTADRAATLEALDAFRQAFGHDPRIGADHSGSAQALHWGPARLSGARARAYGAATRVLWQDDLHFDGDDPASPRYWGDLCRDRIRYWRNFTFRTSNVLDVVPWGAYRDPERPSAARWYAATEAPHLRPFLRAIAPDRLDRVEASGGACLLYTHFGTDFVRDGAVDHRF
ncbi:MAG: hypothetical protein KDB04_07745, partial [Acidimicrobiales bacterium]|nr:hypothetical protein [Acidimicrobiales bacterium]